jgi:RNA recognition motif-containing protein
MAAGSDLSSGLDSVNGPSSSQPPPPAALLQPRLVAPAAGMSCGLPHNSSKNGLVKFNRNVEKDIFGYYCLSFLNDDGEISEKKVRTDFSKFGEVVSVRGALGKQKGHVFVRFRKKEAAENCLNCLNSFPLSEMSELFGRYLFLSPATPRDIDCDMYGLYR